MRLRKSGKWNLKSQLNRYLRRIWLYSPMRKEAVARAKVTRGMWACEKCGKLVSKGEYNVDHIIPVGPLLPDLTGAVERMMCFADGLSLICLNCHSIKSAKDREKK